ncbi:hypothetical protein OSB04_un001053 [Centaurea solstitialis]|uniref:Uncharacterized protein n=1 Tax=Centaurea solstitialis TaxID=347529 RepID=A0AA38SG90_9ASTR|nr:hypothetical protein OSB04_un001053 [Centaurea solstitialis]
MSPALGLLLGARASDDVAMLNSGHQGNRSKPVPVLKILEPLPGGYPVTGYPVSEPVPGGSGTGSKILRTALTGSGAGSFIPGTAGSGSGSGSIKKVGLGQMVNSSYGFMADRFYSLVAKYEESLEKMPNKLHKGTEQEKE